MLFEHDPRHARRVSPVVLATAGGRAVCRRCAVADSMLARLRGLLGRAALGPDEGLLIRPANSIHTAFMRFPIDIVFLDRDLNVLDVRENVGPWRVAARRKARAVVELPAGAAARSGLERGDVLRIEEPESPT